jgi:hypothetical protein
MLGWGTLKLTNSTLGAVECHDVMAGYLENPARPRHRRMPLHRCDLTPWKDP